MPAAADCLPTAGACLPTAGNILPKGGPRTLLDLFCGRGGWSKPFLARGWRCVGVDIAPLGYPGEFVQSDVFSLSPDWIDSFPAILASPPCEEFARAWLPWLRGDHEPTPGALALLKWSVGLCDRPGRLVECSRFAARHVPGAVIVGSWALWGDVPLLMPQWPRRKTAQSGMRPDLRAEIPRPLADTVADWFQRNEKIAA